MAVGAAAGLAAPPIVAQTPDTLTVNAYGGEFQDVFLPTVVRPFEQKFGVRVIYDDAGTAAEDYARIRASRGAPGFDVAAELTPPEIILGARERLLEPLTEREVPNLRHVWAKSKEIIPANGIVHTYQYTALIWNKARIDKPASWRDYWAPGDRYGEAIRGHVINFNPGNLLSVYALIMAAKLGGGGVDNMDPAWALLRAQKPWVGTVVTTSAQAAPYFENGQVWIAPYWSARSVFYRDAGHPIDLTIPSEGTIGLGNCAGIPVGARNKRLAFEFLNFRLDPDVQRAFSLSYKSSPGRPDITDWPADFASAQITTEAQMRGIEFPDSEVIARRRRDWTLRWQEVMGT
ncbi:extracellular solute-binding protein [Muricoccus radiodurans]|uniref:extracellular solute-binding protein n=1 Tax=Muricoccus radiodurans TaxID=2231721 RepID=UPI003CEC1104